MSPPLSFKQELNKSFWGKSVALWLSIFPKFAERIAERFHVIDSHPSPPRGKQAAISCLGEPGIDQQHHAAVGFGPDDTPYRLQYAVHSGKRVGVIKTESAAALEIIADQIALDAKLRQADSKDDSANQSFADQIDPFAKNSAEHGKANQRFVMFDRKRREKTFALGFIHAGTLSERGNFWMRGAKMFMRHREILVGGKINEI